MNWLYWFILGTILAILEFAIPGVIIIFFGIACWIVSFILLIGININLGVQMILCAGISVLLIVVLRKKIKWLSGTGGKKYSKIDEDDFIGKTAVVIEPVSGTKGIKGKIKFEGSVWNASSNQDISENEVVTIKDKDGIILIVEKKQ